MTYGEAVQDPTTKLGAAAKASSDASKVRMEKAQKIVAETGRDLLEVLTELITAELF